MEFIKYNTIEDVSNIKAVQRVSTRSEPNEVFVVTEKIDGANIQLFFHDGEMTLGRRNGWLKPGEGFFDVDAALNYISHAIDILMAFHKQQQNQLRVYGELFGSNVIHRIKYGSISRILFFDMYIGDRQLCFNEFKDTMSSLGLQNLVVPVIQTCSFNEALVFNPEDTLSCCAENDYIEGVVIRPMHIILHPLLKKRTKRFFETDHIRKPKKGEHPLAAVYRSYFTANRTASVISKLGNPTCKVDIGKIYVPALIEDATNDFLKDHPEAKNAAYKCKGINIFQLFLPFLN